MSMPASPPSGRPSHLDVHATGAGPTKRVPLPRCGAPAIARRFALGVATALALSIVPAALPAAASEANAGASSAVATPVRNDQAILLTSTGAHPFSIEIADDPIERSRGLMFREEMARDHGMLFDFGDEAERFFWMKNTPLSLDIIYIRGDGTVVSIAAGTTPFSTDSIPSDGPAQFVLEVNAGVADEIGLAPGDTLLHRRVQR